MNVIICIIGELLVEFFVKEENQGFFCFGEFWGFYFSGVLVIFVDQVVKLGFGFVLFSCVGNDVFGEMNIVWLEKDGVNVNGIVMLQKVIIGSVFVSYCSQVQCDFIFNMFNSVCGLLIVDYIDEVLLNQCQYFYIMGLLLFLFCIIDVMCKVIENIKGCSGIVLFDLNICKEMLNILEMLQVFEYIFDYIDIFLLSDGELDYFGFNLECNEQVLVDKLLKCGVKYVVIKCGLCGVSYFSVNEMYYVVGFSVLVVDLIGVGDCFGVIFVSLFFNGVMFWEVLRWVNVSGLLVIS